MNQKFYYTYILESEKIPNRFYTGFTEDLESRLKSHNHENNPHTSKYRPWKIETAIAFRSREKAAAFEKYLKSHSGRAFAKKRLQNPFLSIAKNNGITGGSNESPVLFMGFWFGFWDGCVHKKMDLLWKHSGFGLCLNTLDLNITADGEDYPQIDSKGELDFKIHRAIALYKDFL